MIATTTTTGLRERKKARQRDRILQAGLELFRERGYAGTSVNEIARLADDAPLRARLGDAGRRMSAEHRPAVMAERYLALYRRVYSAGLSRGSL